MRNGDFGSSLAMARDGLRRWPDGARGWQFRLLYAEDLLSLGRTDEAKVLVESGGKPERSQRGRWAVDRLRLALRLDPNAAPARAREALDAALHAADASSAVRARLILSELASNFREAESYNLVALADAERLHDSYLFAYALTDLGYNRARFLRFDEAIPYLEQARDGARKIGAKFQLSNAFGNLGWCYVMLGDLDRALDAFGAAEKLTGDIGAKDYQQRWLGGIGNIHMIRGDLDGAEQFQRHAADLARAAHNDAWLAIAFNNLAQINLDRGNLASAESFINQALEIKRRLGDEWSLVYSEEVAAGVAQQMRQYQRAEEGYRAVIAQAPHARAPDVLWQAQGSLAFLYKQTGRPALAEAEYRKTIETIDQQWDRLRSNDAKATFLDPRYLIGFFQDYVGFLIERGQSAKALEIAESSRARVLNQQLEHRGSVPPNFNLQKLLAAAHQSHTVLLSYWLSSGEQEKSSVWVLGSGRLSHFDLPPGRAIGALVEKYSGFITQGGDPLAHNDRAAAALYAAVLEPVAKLIPRGSNVIIVPDGALHQLNFETLVAPLPQPHYWIEDVAVATAPSLRVLTSGQRTATRTPKLLLLGDPLLTGQDFAPLPNITKEIGAIAEHFPQADRMVITGARAVPAMYAKASPADFTDIHFATHATANRQSPLNSAIILSHQGEQFKLYARDVADVTLSADLVTISACTSAGAKAYSGEGLMGFAWAFLQAGAQNVIASLWDVDDAYAPTIMGRLYAGVTAGESPARALRAAKLALIHGGTAGAKLPYYWGPLQVFTRRL